MTGLETSAKIRKSPKRARIEPKLSEVEDADEDEAFTDEENIQGLSSNAGWADAMQKILRTKKPKGKKTVVLAKAKKLSDVKLEKKEDIPFEIDGVQEEGTTESEEAGVKTKEPVAQTKPKRRDTLGLRVKPSITDRERERTLQKIATKGVVQLFNAVRQQQTEISKKLSKAGPLERKREEVLKSIDKNTFLDILMGGTKSVSIDNAKSEKTAEQSENKDNGDKQVWSVLRDDFIMGAKLKDWDKKDSEEEENSSAPEDIDSDD